MRRKTAKPWRAALVAVLLIGCTTEVDGGTDAAPGSDAGAADAGAPDAGPPDAGRADSGVVERDGGHDAGPAVRRIVDFSVGPAGACAVDDRGELLCWGSNVQGGLAAGDVLGHLEPISVDLGAAVERISYGVSICATTAAPAIFCWGGNDHGTVGNGVAGSVSTRPFELTGPSTSGLLEAGSTMTCVSSITSGAICWGRNEDGQLAIGRAGDDQLTPGVAAGDGSRELNDIVAVALGDHFACFQGTGGELSCAGQNRVGQLGLGTTTPSDVALRVMLEVTNVSAARQTACAVSAEAVYCWGNNGQRVASPDAVDEVLSPTLVPSVGPATDVVVGAGFACALTTSGEVRCWGSRADGALGDGMPIVGETSGPVTVRDLTDVVALDASHLSSVCALNSSGELYCWGEDGSSRIGGPPPGGQTLFLDSSVRHVSPVRVDPF